MAYKGCAVWRDGVQVLSTGADTDILWNAEHHDVGGFHSTSVDPEKVTVPSGMDGYYHIHVVIKWEGSAANSRFIDIQVNGTGLRTSTQADISEARVFDQQMFITQFLEAGDVVTVQVNQDSGGDLDVQADSMLTVDFLGTG